MAGRSAWLVQALLLGLAEPQPPRQPFRQHIGHGGNVERNELGENQAPYYHKAKGAAGFSAGSPTDRDRP